MGIIANENMKVIYINDSNWFNEDVRGLILFLCVSRGNFDGSDIDDLLFLHYQMCTMN